MNKTKRPPVIIIGMHRSGTSLLTRMLEELGLFVGTVKVKGHYEAKFFYHINEWLFRQYASTWDNPRLIQQCLDNNRQMTPLLDYVRFLMRSPYIIRFLGPGKYMHYNTVDNLDIPWGWKDPRNTYTLPFWLNVFPNAKVINIYRHGVDVAQSLRVRHEKNVACILKGKATEKMYHWYTWIRKRRQDWLTHRCATLEGGISLWEEYMNQARKQIKHLSEMSMEVKYEEFLDDPLKILKSLSDFCELSAKDSDIKKISRNIEQNRAYAYKSNQELLQFADRMRDRLRLYGY